MRKILMKKYEKGLSLIEASMVLALSAIVISGVMFYYQSASDSNKTQDTISEVMSTIAAINGLYVGQSSYKTLDNSVLHNSSAIPQNYKGDGNTITNPFGGEMIIKAGVKNINRYAITLTGVPRSACLNISSMNLGTSLVGLGTNFGDENVADITPIDDLANPVEKKLYSSMTPAGAAKICSSDKNSVSFVMQ
ncbi:TPA: pilus assembly protein [Escherichia coli]|nr:pilus assembly protein [Escherichia coli]HBA9523049.1 pilus assembly protein [Escherichia coli]HBA9551001.1 pilus assembly protein [Escherichia coli]HBA9560464.1 pilus assembly protein [Escherichia coli]